MSFQTRTTFHHETLMVLFHCVVRLGSLRLGSDRFVFPLQFSATIEWGGGGGGGYYSRVVIAAPPLLR